MFSAKKPSNFKEEVTIDYLHSTCLDHQQIVEDLALSEMQSLELAMPIFNTLASLDKTEFNKFMHNFKKRFNDWKVFTVMVAAIMDTATCMIKNNIFYEHYTCNNKRTFDLLMELLDIVQRQIRSNKSYIDSNQLATLIGIFEKSLERLQNDDETTEKFKERMDVTIKQLKLKMLYQTGKENKMDIDQQEAQAKEQVPDCKRPRLMIRNDLFNTPNQNGTTENFKAPLILLKKNTKPIVNNKKHEPKTNDVIFNKKPNMNAMNGSDVILIDDEKTVVNATVHTVPLTSEVIKSANAVELMMTSSKLLTAKKPANAFDIMMMSSKLLTKKKKGTL